MALIKFTRREFLLLIAAIPNLFGRRGTLNVMTIDGLLPAENLGTTLIHEHFLVDFIGADKINSSRWDKKKVQDKVLPYLLEAKQAGTKTIFDCTPAFLGRDIDLLRMLGKASGLQIVTNTGYYGAVQNKYLPSRAFTETVDQLASRWISEFENGIEDTSVRPGFIKISVDAGPLSDVHQKLVRAAARTHLKTGLTICSHTGLAPAAFEQIKILNEEGVHPSAFVWVHAQAETDKSNFIKAASMGCWISLDGIGWGNFDEYVNSIVHLKSAGLLHRVLISHDAGWYKPDEPEGRFQGYTNIFTELIPRLKEKSFSSTDIDQMLKLNPAEAFSLRVRRTN